ncbi:MAG: N-6 DNA methylase, partial [Oligoflexia bacterium]|nr:N-6 DNA methylase [Oligoflexia bacterium]
MSAQAFSQELRAAEARLRSFGLSGRAAYAALCRHLAARLDLPAHLWLEGPDAPAQAHLERLPLTAELDLFGLAYERFFPEVFKAEHGQYFTPRPLVELMADLAGVGPRQRVLDPTCGAGSFLVAAHARGADVDGIELDPELVALCRLNLRLHGADPRAVRRGDLFRTPDVFDGGLFDTDERWDIVLANPPFSVDVRDAAALGKANLAQGRDHISSDALFLEAAWRALRPGGRLCTLMPHSVVKNARHARVRSWLSARFVRQAVVALPEGVFRPFGGTGARAVILCLRKRPAPLVSWGAAVVSNPGYDPTRRSYHPTQPDELATLRLGLSHGLPIASTAGWASQEADEEHWDPATLLAHSGIAAGVPTVRLGALAPYRPRPLRPAQDAPAQDWTEIDLADADKSTGEITAARARVGQDFRGVKATFDPGDVLFARIRPALGNVVIVSRPSSDLPQRLCGSAEWLRLVAPDLPFFALTALRSPFVRQQLRGTGGQTRPRIGTRDLEPV